MSYPIFPERIQLLLNGKPYLDGGFINSFSLDGNYNNNIVNGFSTTGLASGVCIGNKNFSFSWTEYMPSSSDYINWNTYLLANPDTTITVIPFSLASNIPLQTTWTLTGIVVQSAPVNFSGEGSAATRNISLKCIFASNM